MTVTLQETDSASTDSIGAFGTGLSLTSSTFAGKATNGGTPGIMTHTIGNSGAQTNRIGVMWETAASEIDAYSVPTGNWSVNLDVTVSSASVTWNSLYIIRVNSSGVAQATVSGSIAQALGVTGTFTGTLTSVNLGSPSAGDRIVILLTFDYSSPGSFVMKSDLTITTPMLAAATVQPYPQANQRVDALPDFNGQWWEQFRTQPFTSPPPIPLLSRQPSQRIDSLPDFNYQWWEQFRIEPVPVTYIPTPPSTHQASQRADQPFDFTWSWWEQFRIEPVPVSYIPTPPIARQASQQMYVLPDYTALYWQQLRQQPLPSSFIVSQAGVFGIQMAVSGTGQVGGFRVQNNIEGYNVYVGIGTVPDFTQPPAAFSLTLPISYAVTPPVSGTTTFYVCVRKQDTYGLESQNQYCTPITINSSGVLLISALNPPQALALFQTAALGLRILATYAGLSTDEFPADTWYVWVNTTPPNPLVDTPTTQPAVVGQTLSVLLGPESVGTVYVAVALHRTLDGTTSTAITGSIVIQSEPDEVIAVPSGFQLS